MIESCRATKPGMMPCIRPKGHESQHNCYELKGPALRSSVWWGPKSPKHSSDSAGARSE
jgi:hypothetical protein